MLYHSCEFIYTMMEPQLCACSAVLHTHCRSLFAMSSKKENDDHNLKDWFEDYNSRKLS